MTGTLVIAALLLLVVGSLPAPAVAGASLRAAWLVYGGAVLGSVALATQLLNRGPMLPDSEASTVVKYGVLELDDVAEDNVLLIDGGSYANRAIDVPTLHQELERLGYSARAVRLTMSGANHFERHRLQQDIERRLRRKRLPGQRWLLLAEVQRMYDRLPLSTFQRNQDTTRAYHYVTAANAWYAAAALRLPGMTDPNEDWWRWSLLRHAMVNTFNVGVSSRLVAFDSIQASQGTTGRRGGRFSGFVGMKALLNELEQPATESVRLPWLTSIREARGRDLWRTYLDDWIYFGVPSTQLSQLQHVRGFCAGTPQPCIVPDKELLESLDTRKLWRDRGHLNARGSHVYSRWLVHQLAAGGYLKKPSAAAGG